MALPMVFLAAGSCEASKPFTLMVLATALASAAAATASAKQTVRCEHIDGGG
jgi:hypothetical protein